MGNLQVLNRYGPHSVAPFGTGKARDAQTNAFFLGKPRFGPKLEKLGKPPGEKVEVLPKILAPQK